MSLHDYSLVELKSDTVISEFNCDDEDLNDFLFSRAKYYSSELLATTYILEKDDVTMAYYSIFNDSLTIEESNFTSKRGLQKFLASIVSHRKRHLKNIPAIKIGRLAVSIDGKGKGIGKQIIDNIIAFCLEHNSNCACKLITVDAYNGSLGFYEKMGFTFLSDRDEGADTRQMYIDLTPFLNMSNEESKN